MRVICIDADFADFQKAFGYSKLNYPVEGEVYEVRSDNGKGGITLVGITNPYFAISLQPLLFEELHFNKSRFVVCADEHKSTPFYYSLN